MPTMQTLTRLAETAGRKFGERISEASHLASPFGLINQQTKKYAKTVADRNKLPLAEYLTITRAFQHAANTAFEQATGIETESRYRVKRNPRSKAGVTVNPFDETKAKLTWKGGGDYWSGFLHGVEVATIEPSKGPARVPKGVTTVVHNYRSLTSGVLSKQSYDVHKTLFLTLVMITSLLLSNSVKN
jgi:hypothetical protein